MSRKIHKSRLKSYFFENYGYFNSKKGLVRTPTELATQMTDKLPNSLFTSNSKTFLDPHCDASWTYLNVVKDRLLEEGHSLENVQSRIWGFCSTEAAVQLVKFYTGLIHIYCVDFLDTEAVRDKIGEMKFDCVVGNPPYNAPNESGKLGVSTQIWPDFVERSLQSVVDGGHLCLVHPPAWRKPDSPLLQLLSDRKMLFVRFISKPNAVKIFGVQVRVDWYVLKNEKSSSNFLTTVVDEDGVESKINLRSRSFIPSRLITLIDKITAGPNDPKLDVKYASVYGSTKPFISDKKSSTNKFPVIHTIRETGPEYRYSSISDKGIFGVPKVVINGTWYPWAIFDATGEFAVTQRSMYYPTADAVEAKAIIQALHSKLFQQVIEATKWNVSAIIDPKFFQMLKKDFWKDFI